MTHRNWDCRAVIFYLAAGLVCLSVTSSLPAAEPVLPTPPPKTMFMAPDGLFPATRRCLIHGAPLYQDRNANSEVIGRVAYMEPLQLAEGYPETLTNSAKDRYRLDPTKRATNSDWALVCVPDPMSRSEIKTVRGWIPRAFLSETLEAEHDPETLIQKKAVIVTRESQGPAVRQADSVTPLLAPPGVNADASTLPPLNAPPSLELYRLFFVYAEYGDWVLVSPDPKQSLSVPLEDLQSNVFGWVPAQRLARWNTRECFQWDRDSFPARERDRGQLFLKSEDAIRYLKNGPSSVNAGAQVSFPEPDPRNGGKVVKLAKDAMRFHLLLGPVEAAKEGKDAKREWTVAARTTAGTVFTNQLFEVGAVLSDGRVNSRIESEHAALENLASESSDTEILFVIDDTGSMHVAFKVVANIVREISDSVLKSAGKGDVRVGVCYYHDGKDVPSSVDTATTQLESIKTEAGLERRISELTFHEVIKDPLNDPLERVFDGISQGIEKANFKPNSRKLLILLGDCGEKGTSEATLQKLVTQLIPLEASPIEFHAIQLKDPQKKPDFEKFRTDVQQDLRTKYLDRLGEKFGAAFEGENGSNVEGMFSYKFIDTPALKDPDVAVVTEQVQTAILKNVEEARKLGDTLRKALRSFVTTGKLDVEDIAESVIAPKALLKQMLKDEGLDQYGKSPQLYRSMYAWELNRSGRRQLKRMVFLDEKNLVRAIDTLKNLEAKLREGRDLGSEQAIINILAQQVGSADDIPPDLTTDRDKAIWLLKTLSFKSVLFVKLINPKEYGRPQLADFSKVFLKRRLLEAIIAKRKTEPSDYQEVAPANAATQFGEWQPKKELSTYDIYDRSFQRFYKTGVEDVLWYYIDYNEEWP